MLNTAVLGTGLLALDLVERIQASPNLNCGLVIGRTPTSNGMTQAAHMGCATASGGIAALARAGETFDVVFDVTNAFAHPAHWEQLAGTGATLIDLTPTSGGTLIVPTVNGAQAAAHRHIGLITCGGQASIPILHAIAQRYPIRHVEMVATAASRSVGRASRLNLDEYIEATQGAIVHFTGADSAKTMLNISPATTPPPFRTAMTVHAPGLEPAIARRLVNFAVIAMQAFVPGYRLVACHADGELLRVITETTATRGGMPSHAGNLEVISAAAIYAAEQHALATIPALKESLR